MTAVPWVLLAVAAVAAVANWVGVWRGDQRLVYVGKPTALVLLIGVAVTLTPVDPTVRTWFVVALVASLCGDVLLMLPRDLFVAGLLSFFAGHVAYIVGLAGDRRSWIVAAMGLAVVAAGVSAVAPRLLAGVREAAPALVGPVVAYMAVISLMVVAAFGRTVALGIAGALLFYASDAILAWNRFVAEGRLLRVAVMVTYHLGQAALVLSLAA